MVKYKLSNRKESHQFPFSSKEGERRGLREKYKRVTFYFFKN